MHARTLFVEKGDTRLGTTVLVVDDDQTVGEGLGRLLKLEGYIALGAKSAEQALDVLSRRDVDVVLTDVMMPGMSGIELLGEMRERGYADIPTVVMSGGGTLETALDAVKSGAFDFIEKPVQRERLLVTLETCVRYQRLSDTNVLLREDAGSDGRLVGESEVMQRLRSLIDRAAESDARVLITGENGTGKELVAEALHAKSPRKVGPFITLNCAAIPVGLVESELFGHEKGAYTGASFARKGRFQLAEGGTLFLDEVGDMSLDMQAKLLRVLQEGKFERVGGERTRNVDVRVVAATNRDIEDLVREGRFREDLYYRLNVLRVQTPALRDRIEDVPELARLFASRLPRKAERRKFSLGEGALSELRNYDYPGNVRELQNIVDRLAILSHTDVASAEDVRSVLTPERASPLRNSSAAYTPNASLADLVRDAEKRILEAALRFHGGSKGTAAKALGVDRSNFYKKCKQLGIDDP